MSTRRRHGLLTALAMILGGATLFSCASDAPTPSAPDDSQTRTARSRDRASSDGGGIDAASTLDTNPVINTFVLYAERSVKLGTGDTVLGGDVGVAALATQSFGLQMVVGNFSLVDPGYDLLAPSIQLNRGAFVGDVETSSLMNDGGVLRLQAPLPSPMPPVPLALASAPGTSDVTVDRLGFQELTPGAYGALTVNGTLLLQPGVFFFSVVTLGDGGRILALPGGADVRIAGRLTTGWGARLSPLEPEDGWDNGWGPDPHCQHQPASQLSISISGNDAAAGSPLAAALGPATSVDALLFAPHGTLSLGDNTTATGAFAAFDVTVADDVTIFFQAGFSPSMAGQHGLQQLSGYITPPASSAPVVGTVPDSTVISLAFGSSRNQPFRPADLCTAGLKPVQPDLPPVPVARGHDHKLRAARRRLLRTDYLGHEQRLYATGKPPGQNAPRGPRYRGLHRPGPLHNNGHRRAARWKLVLRARPRAFPQLQHPLTMDQQSKRIPPYVPR